MREPVDNRLLELPVATSEVLFNGLSKAAAAVTDGKTSNLNGNVSRVASQGINPALPRHKCTRSRVPQRMNETQLRH
jgi:hypothetical protein